MSLSAADDKSYSLRPRKQSKTHSLTARTKAEAAVDSAEQKVNMEYVILDSLHAL